MTLIDGQVTEEDIAMSMLAMETAKYNGADSTCAASEHPLRVLSQENLTVVSHFTGETFSQVK